MRRGVQRHTREITWLDHLILSRAGSMAVFVLMSLTPWVTGNSMVTLAMSLCHSGTDYIGAMPDFAMECYLD